MWILIEYPPQLDSKNYHTASCFGFVKYLDEKGVSNENSFSVYRSIKFNWKKERPSKQKQYKMRLFVLLVTMSLLSTSLASQTKEEAEETMKIREMTKEVRYYPPINRIFFNKMESDCVLLLTHIYLIISLVLSIFFSSSLIFTTL